MLNKDMDATNLDFIAEFISVDAFEYQIPCLAKTVKLQRADKLVPSHATREKTVTLLTNDNKHESQKSTIPIGVSPSERNVCSQQFTIHIFRIFPNRIAANDL